MIDLTLDQKKMLTALVGECWHHWIVAFPDDLTTDYKMRGHKCYYCGEYCPIQPEKAGPMVPRTFLSGNDMVALMEGLEREGMWEEFYYSYAGKSGLGYASFTTWLFRPTVDGKPHFARLVAECPAVIEWWKKGG